MPRLHYAVALPFLLAGIVDLTGAQAASLRVGDAVQIVHDVTGRQSTEQAWGSKAEGDDVYENEFIRTAVESQARILLVDRTALSVGPITMIRIDRMVHNPDQSIKGIIVSAGEGAVRWTSGDSNSYLIKTPTADVTPIGTVFDLFVDWQRTFVILRQGRANVCTNGLQPTCRMLVNAGDVMLVTANGLQGPARGGPEPADFADRCLSASARNCTINLTYTPPEPTQREPPASKTRRTDIQPSRPRAIEEKPQRSRVVEERPRRSQVVVEDQSRQPGVDPGVVATAAISAILPLALGSIGPQRPQRPPNYGYGNPSRWRESYGSMGPGPGMRGVPRPIPSTPSPVIPSMPRPVQPSPTFHSHCPDSVC
ncbi:FecR domain-containing protein [Bradyrhizobium sp. AZCC 2230]|uniref:FecR domain-containing protein n=1 Tax=Bradyrhizobium sp. AZCC 2230 TaxID=3117021 RepID=UPI00304CFB62